MQVRIEPGYSNWADILSVAMARDPISEERFVKQFLLDPNFDAAGSLGAWEDGRAVGYCLALARKTPLENAPDDSDRGYITLFGVLPGSRHRGIGTVLLESAERYLRTQGRKTCLIAPYAPGYLIPGVDVEAYAEGLAFLKNRGYAEVYRPLAMETRLWDLDVPDWIQGMEGGEVCYQPFQPCLAYPLLEFAREHFPGDWVRVVRETSSAILSGENRNRLWTAISNEGGHQEVVGFAHHERERFGPIGVANTHRGKGIGQTLTLKILQSQREAGYRTSWFLWSDDKTAARLYNHFGFKEARRFAVLRKEL